MSTRQARTGSRIFVVALGLLFTMGGKAWPAEGKPAVYPVAVFPFTEQDGNVKGYGPQAGDILFAKLAARQEIILVERKEIARILEETEAGLAGIVTPSEAGKIGALTGAKVLVTGSVFQSGEKLYVVARIIGTETSRVLGASKTGKPDEFSGLVEALAVDVGNTIVNEAAELVQPEEKVEDRLAKLKKELGNSKRPIVLVKIQERHVGQPATDPAAQTELMFFCKEAGFEVIDPEKGPQQDSDVLIEGEGFSEFAIRRGNLVSVKTRLEVKAVDRKTGRIIVAERQTAVVVDLTEQIAGKKALQEAAASIAERILPRLVK